MNQLTNFNFNGARVRVVTLDNGEPGFVGKDVAERLGYTDTAQAVRQHCRGVLIQQPIPDALGRMQPTRILTEPDVLRLIISSTLPAAQEFERWVFEEVLPSIRKTGHYAAPSTSAPAVVPKSVEAAMLADAISTTLRLEGSARLSMLREAMKLHAPENLPLLPAYAVDAPAGSAVLPGSSRPTAALTTLLAEYGIPFAASTINPVLAMKGLLEQRTRPSTSKGTKRFWCVTTLGERFGKNVVAPDKPRETHPHWYTDTFGELLDFCGYRGPRGKA